MQQVINSTVSLRQKEIVHQYITELDKHIGLLREGKTTEVLEVREFAAIMHMHPGHLSNTVKEVTGRSTCDLFEERLVNVSKELLLNTDLSISQVALQLTYDPSNFTKFFKHYTGMTPKKFREENKK